MLTAEELAIVGYMKEVSETWTQRLRRSNMSRLFPVVRSTQGGVASKVERTSISLAELLFRLTTAADVTLHFGKSVRMIADPVVGQPHCTVGKKDRFERVGRSEWDDVDVGTAASALAYAEATAASVAMNSLFGSNKS